MKCQWEPLQKCMPMGLRKELELTDRDKLQEIRLRSGAPVEWVSHDGFWYSSTKVREDDLRYLINAASRYSPWTAETMAKGYLTIEGGHRIGFCGRGICHNREITGIRDVDSACIRVARDIQGIAQPYAEEEGSVLIIGAPGWGKTTMLRDLCRSASDQYTVVVIDEREELFPRGFQRGNRMDVLSLCPKGEGVEMALRTMCPDIIAVDEITAAQDSEVLLHAANCGISLYATAHAVSVGDLFHRKVYRNLIDNGVFSKVICLTKSRKAVLERMKL